MTRRPGWPFTLVCTISRLIRDSKQPCFLGTSTNYNHCARATVSESSESVILDFFLRIKCPESFLEQDTIWKIRDWSHSSSLAYCTDIQQANIQTMIEFIMDSESAFASHDWKVAQCRGFLVTLKNREAECTKSEAAQCFPCHKGTARPPVAGRHDLQIWRVDTNILNMCSRRSAQEVVLQLRGWAEG
jgi:hypothetical protein